MSQIARFLPILLLSLFASLCIVSAAGAFALEKGMFLIAGDQLKDPRFRDHVILLIQHDAQGSAGLVVNRPSRLPLAAVVPQGSALAGSDKLLSYGGPVEPETLLALVTVRAHPPEPADMVIDGLYVTGVFVLDEWSEFSAEVTDYRGFAGYTGWAAGQLLAEMKRGDWKVWPADLEGVFAGNGDGLRERLLDKLP